MRIWSILWFWFGLEVSAIHYFKRAFDIVFIPTIRLAVSDKDEYECREYSLNIHFLTMMIKLSFYIPRMYVFREGKFIGHRIIPSITIKNIL